MQNQNQKNGLDESISATVASLKTALSEVSNTTTGVEKTNNNTVIIANDECPSAIFTDEKVLARPPFAYVHALAKFFAEQKSSLGWKDLLFPGNQHNAVAVGGVGNGNENKVSVDHRLEECSSSLSKKEKLIFLSRLLALISRVGENKRFDVFVAPSKVLCGRDVLSTHEFLRALASSAVNASQEDMAEAVKFVSKEGDGDLYKRGVRTRKSFTNVQALVRGWQVRREHQRSTTSLEAMQVDEDECSSFSDSNTNNKSDDNVKRKGQTRKAGKGKAQPEKAKSKKSKSDQDALLESYEAVLSRKSKVEDDLKVAESKLQKENDKLIRILKLGTKHKTQTKPQVVPYGGLPRPPLSAPSIGMSTNNSVSRSGSYKIDEAFSEKITDFSERQRTMKQKERRIEDREGKLKQRFARSKKKEAELKLQEERISDLASKIRNQQMHLKEQRLQFERSKLLEAPTDSLPQETTRPCAMCTEKRIQMREIRSKIRSRTRALNQRETVVLGRAQELRRREIQLAKREQVIADWEQQSTVVDDYLSELSCDEPPARRETKKHRNRHKNEKRQEKEHHDHHEVEFREPVETSLPELKEDTSAARPASRELSARKRRRRKSPQEGSSTLPSQMEVEQELLRPSSSLGGESIPTIVEETPDDEQDEQNTTVEDDGHDDATIKRTESGSALNDAECPLVEETMGPMVSDENIAPTNIREARKRLGIAKAKATEPPPRRSTGRKSQIRGDERKDEPKIERRISQPPPPKQRHVFAFERRESSHQNNKMHRGPSAEPRKSIINTGDRSRRISGVTPTRERGENKKPKKASPNKHDDWISSFDVQMKCAMNRLKELV